MKKLKIKLILKTTTLKSLLEIEECTPRTSTFLRMALKDCESIAGLCEEIPEK